MKLDVGKHEVEVTGASMVEANSGTIGICFYFKNEDGDIDCTRWVTEKTYEYVTKDLETMGFARELIGDIANLDRIGEFIKGNRVQIVVEDDTYNGKTEAKVKWINAAGSSGGGKGIDVASKKRLAALLSGKPAGLVSAPRGASTLSPMDDESA